MYQLISKENRRLALIDIIVLTGIVILPSIAHSLSVPLHILDPMRVSLLLSLLFSGNKKNTYLLAAFIPFFSMIVTGHPVFPKSILISFELLVNIYLLFTFIEKLKYSYFISLVFSIFISKLAYYILKYLFLSFNFIEGELITTSIYIQIFVCFCIAILFSSMNRQ